MEQKNHLRAFRKVNPRIDYYPTPEAVTAIERMRSIHPDAPTRALVDMLVLKGLKAYFPEREAHGMHTQKKGAAAAL